ncbi:MAG: hypothetical protein ACRENG_16735 [bacterium]
MEKLVLKTLLLLILVTGCSLKSTVYIGGNEDTIGAVVFIDSVKVGTLLPIKANSRSTLLIVKVKPGDHLLTVIAIDGRKWEKAFYVKGETYFGVEFDDTAPGPPRHGPKPPHSTVEH